jgi:hypothetical protein
MVLWSDDFRDETISGTTAYSEFLLDKPLAVLAGMLTYGRWPDITLSVAGIIAVWWLARRKRIGFAPDMRLPALVLVLTALAMPQLLFGVFGADLRLPCLLYFLLVAASEVRLEGRRQAIAFAMGVTALLALRVGTVTDQWSHFDADYREFRAVELKLDRGSRVVVIPASLDQRADPQPATAYWFISCFAVIDRQVFLPQLYTSATPLALSPEAKDIYSDTLAHDRTVRWHPVSSAFATVDPETVRQVEQFGQAISDWDTHTSTIDWSNWPERFDYLIDFHMGRSGNPVPALLTEVWRGSYFAIYRIHPPRQP